MELKRLGDYCTITSSKRIFADQYVNNGIPFYRSKEIIEKSNNKDITEPLFISSEVYDKIKKMYGVPKTGDILLTSVGTIGIPYLVKDELFYFKDGNLTWMKDFSIDLSSHYVYYWLSSQFGRESLINRCIGSSQSALTIDILKKYKLFIPNRKTQDFIVALLSPYDNLIQNNYKRIKVLEQMAENLYKEWFVRFRFPGHENVEFENGIPKGWTYCRLEKLLEIKYGKEHKNIAEGSIPIFGLGGLMRYGNKAIFSKESVLIPRKGTLNNIMYCNEPFWTVDTMFYTVLLKNNFAKYAYYTLSNIDMETYNSGAALPSMTTDILYHLKILVPDNNTLKLFDDFVSNIINQKNRIKLVNENLIKQRDLLLPRLMSGKLEV